jgi:signal peptide peptidase SppA
MLTDSLQSHCWAMDRGHLAPFLSSVAGLEALPRPEASSKRMQEYLEGEPWHRPEQDEGTATLSIIGPVMARVPAIFRLFGVEAADMGELEASVKSLTANDAVHTIVLNMDTPGGTVGGTQELAAAIRAFSDSRADRQVIVHARGMLASAGMWIASAANVIHATPTTEAGGIGVYGVMIDSSQAHKDAGVVVHVISSGGVKGAGVPGTELTPEQLAAEQRVIDQYNAAFVGAVAQYRGMPEDDVKAINTGETWLAHAAHKLGLVDSVGNDAPVQSQKHKDYKMQEIIDIMAEHPNHAAAIREMHGEGVGIDAIKAYIHDRKIEAQVASANEAVAAAKAELAEAAAVIEARDASLAASEAKVAELQARLDEIDKFEQNTPPDPGNVATVGKMPHKPRSQMTDSESSELIAKMGREAYLALPL